MNILSIEWLKVKKYRTFWVLIGFFILLLPLWNYSINSGIVKMGGKDSINFLNQAYNFQNVWSNLGWWTSIFVTFISILIIILTSNEYSFRTNRQNIIDGLTRLQFYHAKWLMVFALTIFTTIYVFVLGVAFGMSNDDASNFPGKLMPLFSVFVLSLNYYAFGLFLAVMFKRSGLSIGMFFLYSMIIEYLSKGLINWMSKSEVGNYLPLQASDELLPFPLLSTLKAMTGAAEEPNQWGFVAVSFVWIVIYYLIGRYRLLKSDW
ncbi:MAG: ABC transporter permease [Chitinophagales bacterium]|nr:ABC transporter permease [Chitinophagaceae bacterium]MCB9064949.1 ABC transporter permease [Chitinophagales bacterium]